MSDSQHSAWPRCLSLLERDITECTLCPRLVDYQRELRDSHPDWWNRPVPGWGDPDARLAIIGLAPGRAGANRTGRPFTGDAAGVWLYRALHESGFANREQSESRDDGMQLRDCYILNTVKCVPPGNRPNAAEVNACANHLDAELRALTRLRIVLTLGGVAHQAYLRWRRRAQPDLRSRDFPFGHGVDYRFRQQPEILIATYHPSRQNTNTGRLTWEMWSEIFARARAILMPTSD